MAPGAVVVLVGLVLLGAGLTAWLGWPIAATAIGATLFAVGIGSALLEGHGHKE